MLRMLCYVPCSDSSGGEFVLTMLWQPNGQRVANKQDSCLLQPSGFHSALSECSKYRPGLVTGCMSPGRGEEGPSLGTGKLREGPLAALLMRPGVCG